MKNNFKKWLKCALVRAIKTIAQTAVALISVGTVMSDIKNILFYLKKKLTPI